MTNSFTAISWASALLLVAAGTGATGGNSSATVSASTLAPGFYRPAGKATVYRVLDGRVCAVLSEGHLSALGASPKSVRVVSDSVDFLNGKPSAPPCAWPDGFYQRRGENYVIKLSDGEACIVSSTDERVFRVASTDQVVAGKKFVGRCKP